MLSDIFPSRSTRKSMRNNSSSQGKGDLENSLDQYQKNKRGKISGIARGIETFDDPFATGFRYSTGTRALH
jgi:hypothetical protein